MIVHRFLDLVLVFD